MEKDTNKKKMDKEIIEKKNRIPDDELDQINGGWGDERPWGTVGNNHFDPDKDKQPREFRSMRTNPFRLWMRKVRERRMSITIDCAHPFSLPNNAGVI